MSGSELPFRKKAQDGFIYPLPMSAVHITFSRGQAKKVALSKL